MSIVHVHVILSAVITVQQIEHTCTYSYIHVHVYRTSTCTVAHMHVHCTSTLYFNKEHRKSGSWTHVWHYMYSGFRSWREGWGIHPPLAIVLPPLGICLPICILQQPCMSTPSKSFKFTFRSPLTNFLNETLVFEYYDKLHVHEKYRV